MHVEVYYSMYVEEGRWVKAQKFLNNWIYIEKLRLVGTI